LPTVNFILDKTITESYIEAVDDLAKLYFRSGFVPPLAIAAIAKNRMMEQLKIPDGAIQSQAIFDFLSRVKFGESLRCNGIISEHWNRNGVNYVAVDIRVNSLNNRCVLKGRMGFILAPS
jgi:hypothetical protein